MTFLADGDVQGVKPVVGGAEHDIGTNQAIVADFNPPPIEAFRCAPSLDLPVLPIWIRPPPALKSPCGPTETSFPKLIEPGTINR